MSNLYFGTTYYWRVRAINSVDTSDWSIVRTFNTVDYVNLTLPSNGANTWTGVTLDWASHSGVSQYEMELDTTMNFNSGVNHHHYENYINSSNSNTDTEEYMSNLYFGTTYYWRVRAINSVDTSDWSIVRTFNTVDYVTLNSPTNLAINQSTSGVGLDWYSHSGVSQYELEWDTSNLFNSGALQHQLKNYINSSNSNSDTYQNTGNLQVNQTYFWRVRAINAVDTSAWTARVFSTGTGIVVPQLPSLIFPANGATNLTTSVMLDWNDAANASSYEVQYSQSPTFTTIASNITTNSTFNTSGLSLNVAYYWRVRSINGGYYSNWSTVWTFDTYNCSSISLDTSIAQSGVSLTSNASGVTYQWINCSTGTVLNGATSSSFTATANGDYAVIVSKNGCSDTSSCYSVVILGSILIEYNSTINIFPNPVSRVLNVELSPIYECFLIVLNSNGQVLKEIDCSNRATIQVDVHRFPAGVYFLQVQSDKDRQSLKFVKE
jgi:hypothetical protein